MRTDEFELTDAITHRDQAAGGLLISPRVQSPVAAARGLLPLGFGWHLLTSPLAVVLGLIPTHADNWLCACGVCTGAVVNHRHRRQANAIINTIIVGRSRDLGSVDRIGRQRDLMIRIFIGVAVVVDILV